MRIDTFKMRKDEGFVACERGKALLGVRGNRLMLIAGLMVCMFSAVAWIFVLSAVSLLLETEALYDAQAVVELAFVIAEFLLAVLFVFPMILGLYRVVLSLRKGDPFDFSLLFFYFGSFRAYARGLGMTLLLLASVAPGLVLYALRLIAMMTGADAWYAVFGILAAPLVALTIYSSCRCYPFLCLALSDPDTPLFRILRRAIRLTSRRVWSVFVFRMRRILAFLLSLLSIGVVTLVHTLPLTLFASCEFTLLLVEKQDFNAYES